MYIILISYRARGVQQFRRAQLIKALDNFKTYFEKYHPELIAEAHKKGNKVVEPATTTEGE